MHIRRVYEHLFQDLIIDCRKTKPKVITLTNYNTRKQCNEPMNQSKVETNTWKRRTARENACELVMHDQNDRIGFAFASHWLTKWRKFC